MSAVDFAIKEFKENMDLRHELAAAKAENDKLRKGAPLGPIIGAATILEQEKEIKKLKAERDDLAKELLRVNAMCNSLRLERDSLRAAAQRVVDEIMIDGYEAYHSDNEIEAIQRLKEALK